LAKAYTQRKVLGFCHTYNGQESIAVGAAVTTKNDYWVSAYREHGHAIAKGVPIKGVMAELFGKATGTVHGLGGSMHIFDKKCDFLGGWGIVGGHVPLANGVGWAIQHRNEDRVCVCYFGDGSTHQGAFFEALCLAQLYKLPCIFICENNQYAMGTSLERQSAITDLCRRADGVGMVNEQLDGFDVEVVRDRVAAAREFARAGHGPVLLEIITYRHYGHSMSDPAKYRKKGELENKKQSDPLLITSQRLQEDFGVSEADIEAIHQKIEDQAQEAYKFAENSELPDLTKLYDYVYASNDE
jgi:pyruvate dehydrogenase E1 component alpha subunit